VVFSLLVRSMEWVYSNVEGPEFGLRIVVRVERLVSFQGVFHMYFVRVVDVVNWRKAPAYKLSKSFTHKLNHFVLLPNAFNIMNSSDLINQLLQTPIMPTTTFASLDISNMYSNIPITDTRKILEDITRNNLVDPDIRQELLSWYDTITKQNYFLDKDNTIIQKEGLVMGAPSSSILSEIFLQYAEHSHLPRLTQKHKIINYFRYVDDILLIYDSSQTNIQSILVDFNSIHPNLTFIEEIERENTLNFLDITIHKTRPNIKFSIHRKPTFTDTLIPYTSNHPSQHKYSAIRFLYNRLNSYRLEEAEYQQEVDIITSSKTTPSQSSPPTTNMPPIASPTPQQLNTNENGPRLHTPARKPNTEDKGNFIDLLGVIDFNMVTYSIINKLDISSLIATWVIFFFFFTG